MLPSLFITVLSVIATSTSPLPFSFKPILPPEWFVIIPPTLVSIVAVELRMSVLVKSVVPEFVITVPSLSATAFVIIESVIVSCPC